MKAMGYTQEQLAERLGITHSAVSRWLTGSQPRASRMKDLAELLCVSVSELESGISPFEEAPNSPMKPDAQRDATLAAARQFNEALEPAARKLVKKTLRQLDSLLSTAAENDGGMHAGMVRMCHECIATFAKEVQALRNGQQQEAAKES